MKSIITLVCLFMAGSMGLLANNIQVSNVTLTGQNTTANTYQVQFDISWENSWRTSTFESNYDAAWIFIKFREDPDTEWQRALISNLGFVAPAGATIDVSSDAVGAFIHRSADGIGNVNFTGVELQWNYGSVPDDAVIEICVLAIEMVYIPQGPFSLGDDSPNPVGNFEAGTSTNPFVITSENAITLGGNNIANLGNNNAFGMGMADDYNDVTTQTLPASYPKGFNEFYIQKYEISQGQYAAFLNKLSSPAAVNRFPDFNGVTNHTISDAGAPPEVYVASAPDRACNYLSWADVAAYADWSGLRPMTELEYEKACRGPRTPAVDEGAWGNANAFNSPYTVSNSGMPNELFTNMGTGTGNVIYGTTRPVISNGPWRCGIIAASAVTPSRQESGGSYYGVMEMSGNIWEITVTTGAPQGRNFTPNHGNGIIGTSTGNSTVSGWPTYSGGSSGVGIGLRGGGYSNPLSDIRVSSRRLATLTIASRFSDVGGRLVRSSF